MYWIALLLAFGFGIARLTMPVVSEVHREDIFKDMAHLFVGGLFGAAVFATGLRRRFNVSTVSTAKKRFWYLAIGMTVLEVVAFIIHKP